MTTFDLRHHPHRRWNPLTREWILVSPHRTQRPWLGQTESATAQEQLAYDPACYMCPGNLRASGHRNPNYEHIYVFDNDYSALLPNIPSGRIDRKNLIMAEAERGRCRVLCFSPRHDLTVSQMSESDLRRVVETWREQFNVMGTSPEMRYVQIFENRGAIMGASNPHPHCQIWASESVPNEPRKEGAAQHNYTEANGSCLLCDYLAIEQDLKDRIVTQNEHFSALVPFWAIWPFEILVLSRRHISGIDEFTNDETLALATILKCVTARYDRLFQTPFPYSMGFHQRPTDEADYPAWHFHAHFYPPLLRSATVRKFMVGYEMLGSPQRDITAESAAEQLRELSHSEESGKVNAVQANPPPSTTR